MQTPLHLVVETSAGIRVENALGGPDSGPYNRYYFDVSGEFTQGLVSLDARVDRQLRFIYDRDTPFQYSIIPHALLIDEQPPILNIDPLIYSIPAGETLLFTMTASDPDGGVVTLSAQPAIRQAQLRATNGVEAAATYVFSPSVDQVGQYTVQFTARDATGLSTTLPVTIDVLPVNRPPVMGPLSPRTLRVGDSLLLPVPAMDPDGDEVGVFDEYGQQMNAALGSGDGALTFTQEGVRLLAQKMQRGGETVALADMLFAFSHGLRWQSGTPPTLEEWIALLQAVVNSAWSDPRVPAHQMPILIFNRGSRLSSTPPEITPFTRLSPLQAALFVTSFWVAQFEDGAIASHNLAPLPNRWARLRSAVIDTLVPAVHADDPPSGPDRRYSQFWRGMNQQRGDYVIGAVNNAFRGYLKHTTAMAAPTGSLLSFTAQLGVSGVLAGPVYEQLAGALSLASLAARVPEPPPDNSLAYDIVIEDDQVMIDVTFRRSPSHKRDAPGAFIYTLWRFADPNGARQVVDAAVWTRDTIVSVPVGGAVIPVAFGDTTLDGGTSQFFNDMRMRLRDRDPLPLQVGPGGQPARPPNKTWMYAITATRVTGLANELDADLLQRTQPWWTFATFGGGTDSVFPFVNRGRDPIVSDYSRPLIVRVTPQGAPPGVAEMEVDPVRGDVYFIDRPVDGAPRIMRIEDGGLGRRSLFAMPNFAAPGPRGLAVDSQGRLYSNNEASDAMFGGRIWRWTPPMGGREHVGSLNFFSQQLMFANPVASGPMAVGPGWTARSPEDVYVVDELPNVVKRVPVLDPDPPLRRVGQPWADIPVKATPLDIAVEPNGSAHLLVESISTPLLVAELRLAERFVVPGGVLTARVNVVNVGAQTLSNVQALPLLITGDGTLTPFTAPEPAAVDLGVGASATFTLTYQAGQPGIANVQALAQGTDMQGITVGSAPTPVPPARVEVGTPLQVFSLTANPKQVSPGGTFQVDMRVINRGTDPVNGVTSLVFGAQAFARPGPTGSVIAQSSDPVAGQTIVPGGSADFTWTFIGEDMGYVGMRGVAAGFDAGTGSAVASRPFLGDTVTVSPLSISIAAEPDGIRLDPTNQVVVTLSVTNTGSGVIEGITPHLEQVTGQGRFASRTPAQHSPITVNYTVVGGSATPGDDYVMPPGNLVIPAGETSASISLTVINDDLPEPPETVVFRLDSASGAILGDRQFHTFTILDNDKPEKPDKPVKVEFVSAALSGQESQTPAKLRVQLSAPTNTTVTVWYTLGGGTAVVGEDFIFSPGQLTFPPNSDLQIIEIPIIDDDRPQEDHDFRVNLHTPNNAVMGAITSVVYTIIDNDTAVVSFSTTSSSALESDTTIPITVQLDREADYETRVSYWVSGTARRGINYELADGTLTFAPGVTQQTIQLQILASDQLDGDRVVEIRLSEPHRLSLGANRVYRHTIEDENELEVAVVASFELPDTDPDTLRGETTARGLESVSPVDVRLTVSAPAPTPVEVAFELSGLARRDRDYRITTTSPVVIPAGQTSAVLRFDIVDNAVVDPMRDIIVRFTGSTGARLKGGTQFTYWIIDDDVPPEEIGLFHTAVESRQPGQYLHVLGSLSPSIVLRGLALDVAGNYYLSNQGAGGGVGEGVIFFWPRGQRRVLTIARGLTQPGDVELSADGRALVVAGPLGTVKVIPFGVSVRLLNVEPTSDAVVYVRSDTGTHSARRSPDGWFHVPNILVPGQASDTIDLTVEVDGRTRVYGAIPLGANGTGTGQTLVELNF